MWFISTVDCEGPREWHHSGYLSPQVCCHLPPTYCQYKPQLLASHLLEKEQTILLFTMLLASYYETRNGGTFSFMYRAAQVCIVPVNEIASPAFLGFSAEYKEHVWVFACFFGGERVIVWRPPTQDSISIPGLMFTTSKHKIWSMDLTADISQQNPELLATLA